MTHKTFRRLGLLTGCCLILASTLFASHQQLPNFSQYKTITKRKTAFIKFIEPLAKQANNNVKRQREIVLTLYRQWEIAGTLQMPEQTQLIAMANRYGMSRGSFESNKQWRLLLSRVDIVPLSLIIVQAANESAWGTSRFAKQGNNLFGQWCYVKGCGMVPRQRAKGAKNEVKTFSSPRHLFVLIFII